MFCPFSALLFGHGARTVPSSRLDKAQNLLEILPDDFQKRYKRLLNNHGTAGAEVGGELGNIPI